MANPADRLTLRLIGAAPELLASAMAGAALPLMVLLLAGQLHWPLGLPLAAAGAVAAVTVCATSPERIDRRTVLSTVAAAVICAVWGLVNAQYFAENLYAHRDATTYNLAARWLMSHSTMPIPTQPQLFGSPAGYVDASAGFGSSSPGHVYAQGNHLLPVLLAAVGKLFGTGGLLRANVAFAAIGLFVLFGLARRIVGPIWALAVMTAMAVSLPMIYVARDTLSEPLALLYLIGGLLLLYQAIAYHRIRDFALAGFVVATAAMVRIDAYLALLTLVAVAVVLLIVAPVGRRATAARQVAALLGGAVVPVWLGWADVAWLSNGYYHDERTHILAQLAAVVALIVIGALVVALSWRLSVRAWLAAESTRFRAATVGAWLLIAAFAFLVSRPLWLVAHGGGLDLYLEQVQRQADNEIDIGRTYAEQSVSWQALYFGWPTVVLAVAGYVLLLRRFLREREYVLLGILTMGLSLSGLYLWAPNITPDQVYASRRYVPVIMPALLIAAAYALRFIVARFDDRMGRAVGIVGMVTLVAVPAIVTAPVFDVREEVPQLRQVDAICTAVGPHGAVVEIDPSTQYSYQQTIRSYCDVPSLGLPDGASPALLASVRTSVEQAGRTLYVLSSSPDSITFDQASAPGGTAPFSRVTTTRWPSTLHTTPVGSMTEVVSVYLARVEPDGSAHELVTPDS